MFSKGYRAAMGIRDVEKATGAGLKVLDGVGCSFKNVHIVRKRLAKVLGQIVGVPLDNRFQQRQFG